MNGRLWPGVDQIGVVVRSVDRAVESLGKIFGLGPFRIVEAECTNLLVHGEPLENQKARAALGQLGTVQIEIIEPLSGRSAWDEHLATKGEGLHHLGFFVDDYDERLEEMRRRGARVLQSGKVGRMRFTYYEPHDSSGLILEYAERIPPR